MPTPETPKIEERESTNPEFDREFSVSINLDRGFVAYRFFYRLNGMQVDVLGDIYGDTIPVNDDNERDRVAAVYGKEALGRAKKHIKTLHPEVEEIIVRPEELKIGGLYGPEYVAWSREDTILDTVND